LFIDEEWNNFNEEEDWEDDDWDEDDDW